MILEKVRQIIAEQMCLDVENVKPESHIIDDIGADSLDVVEMLMSVEEVWGIVVDDDDMRKFTTVQSVADYIESKAK